MILISPQVLKRLRDLKFGYCRWYTAVYISNQVLEGLETSQSVILDGVFNKLSVKELQRPQNRLF